MPQTETSTWLQHVALTRLQPTTPLNDSAWPYANCPNTNPFCCCSVVCLYCTTAPQVLAFWGQNLASSSLLEIYQTVWDERVLKNPAHVALYLHGSQSRQFRLQGDNKRVVVVGMVCRMDHVDSIHHHATVWGSPSRTYDSWIIHYHAIYCTVWGGERLDVYRWRWGLPLHRVHLLSASLLHLQEQRTSKHLGWTQQDTGHQQPRRVIVCEWPDPNNMFKVFHRSSQFLKNLLTIRMSAVSQGLQVNGDLETVSLKLMRGGKMSALKLPF